MSSTVSTVVRPTLHLHLPSPANSTGYQPKRYIPPPLSLQKVQERSLADEAALHTGGLRTPPAEESMSTAYHHPNHVWSSTYDSHVALTRQPPSAVAQQSLTGVVSGEATLNQISRNQPQPQAQQYQHQPQYPPQAIHHASTAPAINPHTQSASSRHSTRPSTPSSTATSHIFSEGTVLRRESTMVMHSLQLPSCISPHGGQLGDFAALMTCFFWFESIEIIQGAEHIKDRRSNSPIPPLSTSSRPSPEYKKWVTSILSTTQVTQNVILLALLFVYRLKCTNPRVHGHIGSEYRLLTVALMLGNKFLDDNTYTNKTWAEVSGITVKEIHMMEVEFLSNMRYGLLTSKEQWAEWLNKLACFHEYCEKAESTERAELTLALRHRSLPRAPPTMSSPTNHGFSSPLLSPTNVLPSTMQGTPSSLTAFSPNSAVYNANQNWHAHGHYQETPSASPLSTKPSLSLSSNRSTTVTRKRSLEGSELSEPVAKRVTRQTPVTMPQANTRPIPTPAECLRLPIPQLNLDTSQSNAPYTSTSHTQVVHTPSAVSLPPLGQGIRAMSTVYPTSTTWAAQGTLAATCGPQTPSYTAPSNYGTPSKRHSPSSLSVFASSPMTEPFASHSPSIFLQRNSPYKPVRPVNTLNYPPPSIPLSEYHLGSAQMHYQPIGRRNVRTGVVPEFLPAYNSGRPTPMPVPQGPTQHYR